VTKEFKDVPALDAGILAAAQAAAQAAEHYEIARYGTLKTWAGELDVQTTLRMAPKMKSYRARHRHAAGTCGGRGVYESRRRPYPSRHWVDPKLVAETLT
jgi:hypothetical protein